MALWLAQKHASARLEVTALKGEVELERINARAMKNDLDAERLLTVRQSEDFKKLEIAAAALRTKVDNNPSQARHATAITAPTPERLADLRITRLHSRSDSMPEAMALVLWNPATQEGLLAAENLPSPGSGEEYRLWIIASSSGPTTPTDGGVITVDPETRAGRHEFRLTHPLSQGSHFAVKRRRLIDAAITDGALILSGP